MENRPVFWAIPRYIPRLTIPNSTFQIHETPPPRRETFFSGSLLFWFTPLLDDAEQRRVLISNTIDEFRFVLRFNFFHFLVATPLSHLKYMETRRRFDRRCPRTMGKSGFKGDRKIPGRETYSSAIQKRLCCFLPSPYRLNSFLVKY